MSSEDKRGTILILDDESMICEIAEQILNYLGYEVDAAKDGAEAVAMYKTKFDQNKPYVAVVMDLNIPGGIGGKEAVLDVLRINPDAKVVVSSGYSTDPVMTNFHEYGFSGCLTKPFEVAAVEKCFSDLLD